jgi:putative transposase
MKPTRFGEEQIITILKEAGGGAKVSEVCGRHGIAEATLNKWKAKYGGMEVADARRLKGLEEENRRLKKLLAEATQDNAALKDILGKTTDACGTAFGSGPGDRAARVEPRPHEQADRDRSFGSALSA